MRRGGGSAGVVPATTPASQGSNPHASANNIEGSTSTQDEQTTIVQQPRGQKVNKYSLSLPEVIIRD